MPRSTASTIGWGVFCASSWTWCIGMFLPIIMLDRYGWAGFLVFAIPNVLGCAAFGYVLKTRESSERCVERHHVAMRWFSLVTVAYHMFFLAFLALAYIPALQDRPWLAMAIPATVYALGLALTDLSQRVWPWFAALVYAGSVAAFASFGTGGLATIEWTGPHGGAALMFLAPTIIFGFAFCPYLDRTFHRALQASESPHSFGVFGVTFALMLVFTCAYRPTGAPATLAGVVVAHIVGQSVFTVAAHLREVRYGLPTPAHAWARELILLPLVVIPVALWSTRSEMIDTSIYLRFLVFYGLVFPAYVIVFMWPGRRAALTRPAVIAFGIVIAAIMPLYEVGFLHRYEWAIPAGLVGLVAWRWAVVKRAA